MNGTGVNGISISAGNPGFRVGLLGGLIVASCSAGLTIHEAISADADINYALAQTAVLLAFAAIFGLLALGTTISGRTGSGAHEANVARGISSLK
jgi:hypothetical protein